MKKLVMTGMLLASLTALVACDSASVEAAQEERMVRVEHTAYGDILCDSTTGVVYFANDNVDKGGVCVMVDQTGKPLVMGEDE